MFTIKYVNTAVAKYIQHKKNKIKQNIEIKMPAFKLDFILFSLRKRKKF